MSDLRKNILLLMMLGIVLILEYSTFMGSMDMLSEQSPPEDTVGPVQTFGAVQIVSEPSGAHVFFDELDTGQITPFTRMDILPGKYTATVNLTGYHPQSEQFEVFSENITYIRFILVPFNLTQVSSDPVQQAPEFSPEEDDQPDDSPIITYETPVYPVVTPTPEFPSPAIPALMVAVCIGVVLLCPRCRD
jgi:hypothetical protein